VGPVALLEFLHLVLLALDMSLFSSLARLRRGRSALLDLFFAVAVLAQAALLTGLDDARPPVGFGVLLALRLLYFANRRRLAFVFGSREVVALLTGGLSRVLGPLVLRIAGTASVSCNADAWRARTARQRECSLCSLDIS
jgi:hypothetical protein